MRLEGTIKSWNDERGFGFIEPTNGGRDVFVHIQAFGLRNERPESGQRVSYELAADERGRPRALNVQRLLPAGTRQHPEPRRRNRRNLAVLLAIPAFLVAYGVASVVWSVPSAVSAAYIGTSILAFLVYAFDKFTATRGGWRTSESTLLLLALAGGWPGALLAQQLFRHKTSKTEFRTAFWFMAALNIAAFALLVSPVGPVLLANL
jgi:uncharacterized membrane protein YsdA (DUF1294 family)/cold shock CspA family protein